MPVEDDMAGGEDTLGEMEIGSPLLTMEETEDKNEEGEIEVEETTPESSMDNKVNNDANDEEAAVIDHVEKSTTTTSALTTETGGSTTEVKPEESAGTGTGTAETSNSTTINLNERARLRSLQRLAGTNTSPPPPAAARGRGRQAPRGRSVRGGRAAGRGGAGQNPASQGYIIFCKIYIILLKPHIDFSWDLIDRRNVICQMQPSKALSPVVYVNHVFPLSGNISKS